MKRREFIKKYVLRGGILVPFVAPAVLKAGPPFVASPRSPYRSQVFPPAAAAGGGQSASDDFNRANETPLAGNWTTITGQTAFNLATNQIAPSANGNDAGMYYNAITPTANQWASAAITSPGTGASGQGTGVAIRCSTGANTFIRCVIDAAGANNIELGALVAGVYTAAAGWPRTVTYVAGAVLKVSAVSNTITVTYNGSAVGADTTITNPTTGRWGLAYSSNEPNCKIDNFLGGEN